MYGDETKFGILFMKYAPHIVEKIFSLDYESFQTCPKVESTWDELLTSDSYQVFHEKVSGP